MPSGTLYSVAVVRTDVSEEHIVFIFRVKKDIMWGRRTLVFWDVFTAVSMKRVLWNFVPFGCS
jgi:hypothetical protein